MTTVILVNHQRNSVSRVANLARLGHRGPDRAVMADLDRCAVGGGNYVPVAFDTSRERSSQTDRPMNTVV